MTFKVGQWVVVDTSVSYWPIQHKNNKGPFRIVSIDNGIHGKYAVFNGAPNNAYFKHIKVYVPQVGDKVEILKPMSGYFPEGNLPNTVGQIGTVRFKHTTTAGSKRIRIDEWWYLDEEDVYELVEPKGSINPEPVKPTPEKPARRVLNADV